MDGCFTFPCSVLSHKRPFDTGIFIEYNADKAKTGKLEVVEDNAKRN